MQTEAPPRGGVVDDLGPRAPVFWPDAAQETARDAAPTDPVALPDPLTAFQWLDRAWRPALGAFCGIGVLYTVVLGPMFHRETTSTEKFGLLVGLAAALAGAKSLERASLARAPISPASLFGAAPRGGVA